MTIQIYALLFMHLNYVVWDNKNISISAIIIYWDAQLSLDQS